MKTAGIIGGIGPESTIEYYRLIVSVYRQKTKDGSYPRLLINSINLQQMRDLVERNDLPGLAEYLLEEIGALSVAGATFAALSANTPHIVFAPLQQRSPIPLISIVEVTCRAAQALGLTRLGLLGTRFTMQGRFYPEVFSPAGITLMTPAEQQQEFIHEKYMGELVNGVFLPATRQRLLAIVRQMQQEDQVQGIILGGTELPLLLRPEDEPGIPFLDTTRLHVEAIVKEMLS